MPWRLDIWKEQKEGGKRKEEKRKDLFIFHSLLPCTSQPNALWENGHITLYIAGGGQIAQSKTVGLKNLFSLLLCQERKRKLCQII